MVSVSLSFPACASWAMATLVKSFEFEPTSKRVRIVFGTLKRWLAKP